MKKIIATVLAMVMALALCTVAFAADRTTLDAEDYKVVNMSNTTSTTFEETDTLVYNAESKTTTTVNGKTTVEVAAAYYVLNDSTYYVVCDSSCADAKLVKGGKVVDYVWEVTNAFDIDDYTTTATVSKTIKGVEDPSCGQYADGTYYVVNATTYSVVDGDHADVEGIALLNGKLVVYAELNDGDFVEHDLNTAKVNSSNGTVKSVYCNTCKKYIDVVKTVPADSVDEYKAVDGLDGYYYLATAVGTAGAKDDTKPSPKTFDAGIAMYVGMALTSVAGSAVVIGKKKEF